MKNVNNLVTLLKSQCAFFPCSVCHVLCFLNGSVILSDTEVLFM